MKNERIDLERTLALSTAHIPIGNPDFGGARHVRHEYGFVVFVMKYRTLPTWLTPVFDLAIKHNCTLINFDRDCATVLSLPTYEWHTADLL